jgi:hypothetical protein
MLQHVPLSPGERCGMWNVDRCSIKGGGGDDKVDCSVLWILMAEIFYGFESS